jgi:hypothetical protein
MGRRRYSIATLAVLTLLLGSFLHAPLAFACKMADATPRHVCCCAGAVMDGCNKDQGHGDGCGRHAQDDCCSVSVEADTPLSAKNYAVRDQQVPLLPIPQSPPFPVSSVAASAPLTPWLDVYPLAPPLRIAGTRLYLAFGRLLI